MPVSVSLTKKNTVGFWHRRSGSITINVSITQSGYIPGQTLYFTATVENLTEKNHERIYPPIETGIIIKNNQLPFHFSW